MNNPIFSQTHIRRINLRFLLLICFALYSAWQMAIVYFSGTALSIDGRILLPVSINNMTFLIALGYILPIVLIVLLPKFIVMAERVTIILTLSSVLAFYLPLSPETLAYLFYFQCFCCIFVIGFETSLRINPFSEETSIRHLLLAYAFANIVTAFMHNDLIPVFFSFFMLIIVICLVLLLVFFLKLPTKVWPRYMKKSDNLILPKQFFIGIYVLCTLGCFTTLFGTAVAGSIVNGVFVAFISSCVYSIILFLFWRCRGIPPLWVTPFLSAIAILGFVLTIVSLHMPDTSMLARIFLGAGITTCWLNPFYGTILAKRYPSKYIAPMIIIIAFATVLVQSALLEAFRNNLPSLYALYLTISVIMTIVYLMSASYLTYSFRGKLSEAESLLEVSCDKPLIENIPSTSLIDNISISLPSNFDILSRQELRIAVFIIKGFSNAEMAQILNITENTVKSYRKTLYSKLQIHSKQELFELAKRI